MSSAVDLLNSHIFVDGQLVSAKIERLVRAIKDYEPQLKVKWIPPSERSEGQAAFAIIHDAPGNAPYVLFYVQTEEEFDERVLLKIIANDQRNGKRQMTDLEAWDEAQQRIQKQEFLDKMEEANDIAAHVFRSHLNTYKVNDQLTIRE